MLIILATLTAGTGHQKFSPGTSVPAVLFAAAAEIDEAEEMLAPALRGRGWSKLATKRYKTLTSRPDDSSPIVEAYDTACTEGVGYVIFP